MTPNYKRIVNDQEGAILIKNCTSDYQYTNSAFQNMIGTNDTGISANDYDFFSTDDAEKYQREDQHVLKSRQPLIRHQLYTTNRTAFSTLVIKTPIFENDKPKGIFCRGTIINKSQHPIITRLSPMELSVCHQLIHSTDDMYISQRLNMTLSKIKTIIANLQKEFSTSSLTILKAELLACNFFQLELDNEVTPNNETTLTQRESDCVNLLLEGLTHKAIAAKLNISPRTVEEYFVRVKTKFNLKTRTDIIKFFTLNGP